MDLVYLRHASLWYDLTIIFKTAVTILLIGLGKRQFAEPPEISEARDLMEHAETPLVCLTLPQEQS